MTSLGHSACLVAISKMSKHSSCLELDDEPDKPDKHDKTKLTNNLTELKLSSKGSRTKNIEKIYKTWALEIKGFLSLNQYNKMLCYFCHKCLTTFGVMQYGFLIVEGYLLHKKQV